MHGFPKTVDQSASLDQDGFKPNRYDIIILTNLVNLGINYTHVDIHVLYHISDARLLLVTPSFI